jgi:hypothetical protein
MGSCHATQKQWRLLNTLGFVLTWLLFAGWYVSHYNDAKFWPTTIFLNLFFLIYTFIPFAYYFLRQGRQYTMGLTITVLNTFVAFAFSYTMIQRHTSLPAVSLVSLAYAGSSAGALAAPTAAEVFGPSCFCSPRAC